MRDNQPYRLSAIARFRIWSAPLLLQFRDYMREVADDMPLLTRAASHVSLLFLMLLAIAVSGVQITSASSKDSTTQADTTIDTSALPPEPAPVTNVGLFQLPNPVTNSPKRVRRDVLQYTVRPGDTVSGIADQYDVTADSVLWANSKLEDNPDMLSLGQVLNIPPVSGVLYTVVKGDTVQSIANKFKTTKVPSTQLVQNILASEFNQEHHELKDPNYALTVGQFLMVPDGTKPYVPRFVTAYNGPIPATAARGTGNFGWPVSGRITQKFWTHHPGIDIAAPKGTPIYAADSGYVVFAGWDNERVSYGFMLLINHGNGFITRYAHLSAFAVQVGDSVKKGQLIGRVGSTGNSTGPHLHFEIINKGVRRNPFNYLPGG